MKPPNFKEFYRIKIEDHDLYHVSQSLFDFPDSCFLKAETNHHNNGALGVWASTRPLFCSNFGSFTYKFRILKEAKIIGWGIRDFFIFCQGQQDETKKYQKNIEQREKYIKIRKFLLDKGIDVIYLLDSSDCVNEVIVINYEMITNFQLTKEYKDLSIPIVILDKYLYIK